MLTAYAAYVACCTADITRIVAARNGRRAADIAHYAADSPRGKSIFANCWVIVLPPPEEELPVNTR